jgi:Glycosyl transferase family 2
MTVTAIIPHYWDSRKPNLLLIVDALRGAGPILIWNNMPGAFGVTGADVINANKNWGIAARFAAAYLAQTDFVLFQDNDVLVQAGTVKNMLSYAPDHGESVELQGRIFGPSDAPYWRSEYVTGVDRIVDVGLSRISLMRRSTAMHLAGVIPPDVTDDDIWTSRHCRIRVVPYGEGEGFTDLPESEGLSRDAVAHVKRRDVLVKKLWNL